MTVPSLKTTAAGGLLILVLMMTAVVLILLILATGVSTAYGAFDDVAAHRW